MSELPSGTVTFLFTDIEGSTRLVKQLGERYVDVRDDHERLLRGAFEAVGGREIDTQGDAFFVAFARARDAVAAAVDAQRALVSHPWPDDAALRVRMGVHTGEPAVGSDRYVGVGVHRAARICSAAHGGQVLLSGATRELVQDELSTGVTLRELGEYRLRDIERPERLFQLVIAGLPSEFPPPRTHDSPAAELAEGREDELAKAAAEAVSRRSLSPFLAIGAAALLAAAAVALFTLRAGGGIVVAPNSVAVIDPGKNRVVGQVTVGTRPGAIAFGEGAVWVANVDERTLLRVDPRSRAIERTISLKDVFPSDVAAGEGAVWVADGYYHTVARVSAGAADVVAAIAVPSCGTNDASVSVGDGSVWFVCQPLIARITPETNRASSSDYLGLLPRGVATGLGAVWVSNSGENTVSRIDPQTKRVTNTFTVAREPRGLATGSGAVWVSAFGDDSVSRLGAPAQGLRITSESIDVGDGPIDVAVGADGVWVANSRDGTVTRIDPRTNRVVATIRVGNSPRAIAVGAGMVWVSVQRGEPGGLSG